LIDLYSLDVKAWLMHGDVNKQYTRRGEMLPGPPAIH